MSSTQELTYAAAAAMAAVVDVVAILAEPGSSTRYQRRQ
jgi:hypothetical protein